VLPEGWLPQAATIIVAAMTRPSQKRGLTMRGTKFIPPLLVGGTPSQIRSLPVPPADDIW